MSRISRVVIATAVSTALLITLAGSPALADASGDRGVISGADSVTASPAVEARSANTHPAIAPTPSPRAVATKKGTAAFRAKFTGTNGLTQAPYVVLERGRTSITIRDTKVHLIPIGTYQVEAPTLAAGTVDAHGYARKSSVTIKSGRTTRVSADFSNRSVTNVVTLEDPSSVALDGHGAMLADGKPQSVALSGEFSVSNFATDDAGLPNVPSVSIPVVDPSRLTVGDVVEVSQGEGGFQYGFVGKVIAVNDTSVIAEYVDLLDVFPNLLLRGETSAADAANLMSGWTGPDCKIESGGDITKVTLLSVLESTHIEGGVPYLIQAHNGEMTGVGFKLDFVTNDTISLDLAFDVKCNVGAKYSSNIGELPIVLAGNIGFSGWIKGKATAPNPIEVDFTTSIGFEANQKAFKNLTSIHNVGAYVTKKTGDLRAGFGPDAGISISIPAIDAKVAEAKAGFEVSFNLQVAAMELVVPTTLRDCAVELQNGRIGGEVKVEAIAGAGISFGPWSGGWYVTADILNVPFTVTEPTVSCVVTEGEAAGLNLSAVISDPTYIEGTSNWTAPTSIHISGYKGSVVFGCASGAGYMWFEKDKAAACFGQGPRPTSITFYARDPETNVKIAESTVANIGGWRTAGTFEHYASNDKLPVAGIIELENTGTADMWRPVTERAVQRFSWGFPNLSLVAASQIIRNSNSGGPYADGQYDVVVVIFASDGRVVTTLWTVNLTGGGKTPFEVEVGRHAYATLGGQNPVAFGLNITATQSPPDSRTTYGCVGISSGLTDGVEGSCGGGTYGGKIPESVTIRATGGAVDGKTVTVDLSTGWVNAGDIFEKLLASDQKPLGTISVPVTGDTSVDKEVRARAINSNTMALFARLYPQRKVVTLSDAIPTTGRQDQRNVVIFDSAGYWFSGQWTIIEEKVNSVCPEPIDGVMFVGCETEVGSPLGDTVGVTASDWSLLKQSGKTTVNGLSYVQVTPAAAGETEICVLLEGAQRDRYCRDWIIVNVGDPVPAPKPAPPIDNPACTLTDEEAAMIGRELVKSPSSTVVVAPNAPLDSAILPNESISTPRCLFVEGSPESFTYDSNGPTTAPSNFRAGSSGVVTFAFFTSGQEHVKVTKIVVTDTEGEMPDVADMPVVDAVVDDEEANDGDGVFDLPHVQAVLGKPKHVGKVTIYSAVRQ